jgi:hypothetical protein
MIKAPDENAGKKARCPYCKSVIVVPEPIYDAEDASAPAGAEQETYGVHPTPTAPPKEEERRPCPMCGEMILATAVKCRYCGEIFDEELKRRPRKSGRGGGDPTDSDLAPGDYVMAVICSGIGCIMGIVYMIQGRPKGIKMFGLSILFIIVWNVLLAFLQTAGRR